MSYQTYTKISEEEQYRETLHYSIRKVIDNIENDMVICKHIEVLESLLLPARTKRYDEAMEKLEKEDTRGFNYSMAKLKLLIMDMDEAGILYERKLILDVGLDDANSSYEEDED